MDRLAFSVLGLTALLSAQLEATLTAAPGTATVEPGRTVACWLYNGMLPGPTLRVREGQLLRVRFVNRLPEATTVHFHGQPMPNLMDGVPDMPLAPIAPNQEFTYEFVARPAGTYWFHPHVGLQIDRGLAGVLIVDPAGPGDPGFDREHLLVLDDLLEGPPIPGRDPVHAGHLLNGKTSLGQQALAVRSGERVRLRIVNAAAASHYVLALDGHEFWVTHADGQRVVPVKTQALPIGAGERYDLLLEATNPGTWSLAAAALTDRTQTLVRAVLRYEGSTQPWPTPGYVPPNLRNGVLLTYAQLQSAVPVAPIKPVPDRVFDLQLAGGMMGNYVWTINGQAWPNASPLPVIEPEAVRLRFTNMSMHWHPMHLHGHFFRLLGTVGGALQAPQKDTLLIAPGMMSGRTEVEFVADNPGSWMLHCHNLYHAEAGMMRAVMYGGRDHDADGLMDDMDFDPVAARPVAWTEDLGGGYAIGRLFRVLVQWPAGEGIACFAGAPLDKPIDLGPLGLLQITPDLPAGAAICDQRHVARVDIPVPADPALRGLRVGFQAVATPVSALRLSTSAVVRLQ